ncbi:MAG: hypothetical protein HQK52_01305 [Oligoflexia bacterium]|nr:hypothetical protein [Oligoflexia bacterium]
MMSINENIKSLSIVGIILLATAFVMKDLSLYTPTFLLEASLRGDLQGNIIEQGGRVIASSRDDKGPGQSKSVKSLRSDFYAGTWQAYQFVSDKGVVTKKGTKIKLELIFVDRAQKKLHGLKLLPSPYIEKWKYEKVVFNILEAKQDKLKQNHELVVWGFLNSNGNYVTIHLRRFSAGVIPDDDGRGVKSSLLLTGNNPPAVGERTIVASNEKAFTLIEITTRDRIYSLGKEGRNEQVASANGYGQMKLSNQLDSIKELSVSADIAGSEVYLDVSNIALGNGQFYYQSGSDSTVVSGLLNNFGEDEYIMALANGPFAGMKFRFMSESKLIQIAKSSASNSSSNSEDLSSNSGIEIQPPPPPSLPSPSVPPVLSSSEQLPQQPPELHPATEELLSPEEAVQLQNEILAQRYEQMKATNNTINASSANSNGYSF